MEMSLMQYFLNLFYHILISNRIFEPNLTDLCRLAESMLLAEREESRDEDWQKWWNKIQYIYENTHEDVKTHLSIMELAYFKNVRLPVQRKIEIQDNNGELKEYYTTEIYKYLDLVGKELVFIVVSIAKKYSLEIPFNATTTKKQTEI